MELNQQIEAVCRLFRIPDTYVGYEPIQMGNVHKTYKVNFLLADGTPKSFLLQNVNTYAFRRPVELMENIDNITEFIRKKNPGKLCLHFHHTADRKTYIIDGTNCWRMTNYINSVTYRKAPNAEVMYSCGKAFGDFQHQLSDFDSRLLYETIPNFHNTRKRYDNLDEAIRLDSKHRVQECTEEIAWVQSVRDLACRLTDLLDAGQLPLRVTHNDTKISNVLFDSETNEPLVVIDLDTTMPGVMGHDFGDAIRYAANRSDEDCPDPSQAGIDLDIYRSFVKGFLEPLSASMTKTEADTLALSCFCLTTEVVVRFLEDYLRGDPYFNTAYEKHNLVRTRCQMALAKDMLLHMDEMEQIVRDYLG